MRWPSFSALAARNAAVGAALALVGIQVGMGLVLKFAQTKGDYAFSPSSSVTISEFLKMLLSLAFFWRECRRRGTPVESTALAEQSQPLTGKDDDDEDVDLEKDMSGSPAKLTLRLFLRYLNSDLPTESRYGFAKLALFYVLINNTVSAISACNDMMLIHF